MKEKIMRILPCYSKDGPSGTWVTAYVLYAANGRYLCTCNKLSVAQKIRRAWLAFQREGRT